MVGNIGMSVQIEENVTNANASSDSDTVPEKQATGDRRRPGRMENVSPALIPVLRQPTLTIDLNTNNDDFRLSKGIAVGVLLAVPFWALIFAGISLAVR